MEFGNVHKFENAYFKERKKEFQQVPFFLVCHIWAKNKIINCGPKFGKISSIL